MIQSDTSEYTVIETYEIHQHLMADFEELFSQLYYDTSFEEAECSSSSL